MRRSSGVTAARPRPTRDDGPAHSGPAYGLRVVDGGRRPGGHLNWGVGADPGAPAARERSRGVPRACRGPGIDRAVVPQPDSQPKACPWSLQKWSEKGLGRSVRPPPPHRITLKPPPRGPRQSVRRGITRREWEWGSCRASTVGWMGKPGPSGTDRGPRKAERPKPRKAEADDEERARGGRLPRFLRPRTCPCAPGIQAFVFAPGGPALDRWYFEASVAPVGPV